MNAEHKAALARGRLLAQLERRRESVKRVDAYKAWCRSGSPPREIPEIPSDHDYVVWRETRSP